MSRVMIIAFLVALGSACGSEDAESDGPVSNDASTNNAATNNSGENTTNNTNTNNLNNANNGESNNGETNNVSNNTNNADNSTNNMASGCALDPAFDAGAAYADEIRLEAGGDIEAALRDASPGTRITLAPGDYDGGIFADAVQGSADAPIALVGEDGAVVRGGTTNMQLSNPRYLVIENIEFTGASQNGLNIDDGADYSTPARFVILRDIVVSDVGNGGNQDCIKLSGLDDFRIEGVTVSQCSGQAIDMVGCHDGLITSNVIRDTAGAGIQAKGGSADVLIHANLFENVEGRGINAGGSTGLEFFRPIDAPHEGARIVAFANVFVDVGESSGAPIAYVGCDACEFRNNTVVRPLTWVARILQETVDARFVPSRNGIFANNIIVFDSQVLRTFVNVGANTAPETFSFRNNLWWDLSDPDFAGPSLGGGIPTPVGSIVGDPGFDTGSDDFSIDSSSPAAGLATDVLEWPDFSGRCYADENPSAGAFEVP